MCVFLFVWLIDFLFTQRNSTELWNGLGESHIQALAMAQDINVFFLVLLFGKFLETLID